ncbi:hypothetical protein B566_EDAN000665 [Ephemera danica]|nr:hypothetical protein B566_EDAN000665 [Ephemera danica]
MVISVTTLTVNETIAEIGPHDPRLPIDMRFNEGHVVAIAGFAALMLFSSIGNITVLYSILRSRTKSQINLMLSHLAVADLLVTFLMMPMEIGWAITVQWEGGAIMCRLMSFFRAFGLYLSGFVAVVFSEEQHPDFKWFTQCVTFRLLNTDSKQVVYAAVGVIIMYFLPLVTIVYCYTAIILEICRRAVDIGEHKMRRSNSGNLCRAKVRTLKMTVTIVAVFLFCWTPYNVMLIWYFIDRAGALGLDPKVQRLLFLFSSTNSSFNPLVYGLFNIRGRQARLPVPASVYTVRSPTPSVLYHPSRSPTTRSKSSRLLALRTEAAGLPSSRRPTV